MKIHSHYDNLKVSRDAPQEVIRAAYKTLCQKYHPDRRIDDPDAERVMKIINASYAVLSDPVQRKEHDEWLARKEREAAAAAAPPRPSASASQQQAHWQTATQTRRDTPPPRQQARSSTWTSQARVDPRAAQHKPRAASSASRFLLRKISLRSWAVIGVCAFFGYVAITESMTPWPFTRNTPSYGSQYGSHAGAGAGDANAADSRRRALGAMSSAQAATSPWKNDVSVAGNDPSAAHVSYVRPAVAPNGLPWPSTASYLDGMSIGAADGHSSVTIDNSVNRFDVFGKLVYNASVFDQPVRHFFIPAGQSFTLVGVAPGNYDVRYQNLDDGGLYKSQGFELSEQAAGGSIDATNVSITLYGLPGSTVQPTTIGRGDF